MGSATVLDTGPHWNKEDHVGQARMRHIWLAYKKEWESVWWAGKLWEGPRNSTGYFSASEGWASSSDRNKIKAWREISLEKAIHFKAWNREGEPATAHQILQTWTHSAQDSLQHPNFLVPKPNDGKYWFVQDCDDWLWSIHPHSSTGAKPIHPPHLGARECSVFLCVEPQRCITLYSPTSRSTLFPCLWVEGPQHPKGYSMHLDSASAKFHEPPTFWKYVSKNWTWKMGLS